MMVLSGSSDSVPRLIRAFLSIFNRQVIAKQGHCDDVALRTC